MLTTVAFIRKFFTGGHERTVQAKKNVIVAFVCKGLSILIGFIIVPLTLGYVGKVEYGIWMTISSIISWFAFFDIGLSNGLRNKLAEALAQNDKEKAKVYISSVFAIISGISVLLFLFFFIAANYISWNNVLNTNAVPNKELFLIVVIVFFFFCVEFILKTVSMILQAMQRYGMNNIIGLIAQLLGLLAVFILVRTTDSSLLYLCLVYGAKTAVVLLFASVILFFTILKEYRPSIKYLQIKTSMPLINLGIKFFIAQILYMLVNQTAVILVVQFFGPADVTVYNLAIKYMTIFSMIYLMIITPFLSAFTEAYVKKEFDWIRSTIRQINMIWAVLSCATLLLVFCYQFFFNFWVGNTVSVPFCLILSLAVLNIITMWNGTFGLFLNGIGKIQIQLYIVGAQALLFFPLTYLFYYFGFGLVSIVSAQIIFYFFGAVIVTKQYKKIINQTAKGLWIK